MSTPVMTQAEAALHQQLQSVRHERAQCERLANISREHIDRLLVALYELSFPLLGNPEHCDAAGKAHDIAVEIEDWWYAEENPNDDE